MFEKIIDKLRSVKQNDIMQTAVAELQDDIEVMNRDQMWKGKDSDGNQLQPFPYSSGTIRMKKKKGQPVDRITLKDSGQFHDSIKAKALKKAVVIGSNRKAKGFDLANHLDNRYGEMASIYGLTDENMQKFFEKLRPIYLMQFKKATGI